MKAIGLFVFTFLITAHLSFAQFYVRGGLGYAFPQAGTTGYSGSSSSNTNSINYNVAYSVNESSFSSGVQSFAGLGYMFNKNIGVQVDANVGISNSKYTLTHIAFFI